MFKGYKITLGKYLLVFTLILVLNGQIGLVSAEAEYGYELEKKYNWRMRVDRDAMAEENSYSFTADVSITVHNQIDFNLTQVIEYVRGDKRDFEEEDPLVLEYESYDLNVLILMHFFNRIDAEFTEYISNFEPIAIRDYWGVRHYSDYEEDYEVNTFTYTRILFSYASQFNAGTNQTRTYSKQTGILLHSIYHGVTGEGYFNITREYTYKGVESLLLPKKSIPIGVGIMIVIGTGVVYIKRRNMGAVDVIEK